MRSRPLAACILLLAPILLAGCTGEAEPGPRVGTARELLPDPAVLGEPAGWAAEQGAKRHVPVGEARLFMAFAVESAGPAESPLVERLYSMREHVTADDAPGDGAAPQWLYQYKDDSSVSLQHVSNASGPPATTSWGAVWDWGYWALPDPSRPVGEWRLDSAEAARVAAQDLLGWGEPMNDHFYLLFTPPGTDAPHWLLGTWWPDGTREHVLLDASSGEKVDLASFYPLPAPQEGRIEDRLVKPLKETADYPLVLERSYGRIVARIDPATPDALTVVFIDIEGKGWGGGRTETGEGGSSISEVFATNGGGNATIRARLDGQAEAFTIDWCADGIAMDPFGRTATDCDRLWS